MPPAPKGRGLCVSHLCLDTLTALRDNEDDGAQEAGWQQSQTHLSTTPRAPSPTLTEDHLMTTTITVHRNVNDYPVRLLVQDQDKNAVEGATIWNTTVVRNIAPGQLIQETIWDGRRLVIEEKAAPSEQG